jgi:hypothetical protein
MIVADYVFVIIALPKATAKWRPTKFFDAINVSFRRHRFEPMHHIWQR